LVLFFLVVCLGSGCRYIVSEPLPDFVHERIEPSGLPENIRQTFSRDHPDSTIEAVETSSFKRKIQEYRITFSTTQGAHGLAINDSSANPVNPPRTFRP
jgi:hypothetical protein